MNDADQIQRNNSAEIVRADEVRQTVRDAYTRVATSSSPGCGTSCCGTSTVGVASTRLGYTETELADLPAGSDMGLGCGNPQRFADLRAGATVIDLGAGGGLDSFFAAQAVGAQGRVIGVDMTPEMVSKARANAVKGGYQNVEFRLGEIENLPVADGVADVVISNCVINLSPDKPRVFREAYRVLKRGGRLAISDVVAIQAIPDDMRENPALVAGCMGNAALVEELRALLTVAGFRQIDISIVEASKEFIRDWSDDTRVADYVASAMITAVKRD